MIGLHTREGCYIITPLNLTPSSAYPCIMSSFIGSWIFNPQLSWACHMMQIFQCISVTRSAPNTSPSVATLKHCFQQFVRYFRCKNATKFYHDQYNIFSLNTIKFTMDYIAHYSFYLKNACSPPAFFQAFVLLLNTCFLQFLCVQQG